VSIRMKINVIFLILGLIATGAIAGYNYMDARNRIFEEAFNKASLVSSFAMASRQYTVETMRPLAMQIAAPGSFHPEIMGGFFVARAVAEKFAKAQPGYQFKQAALNPVNAINRADDQESAVIQDFAGDRNKKIEKGIMVRNGEKYFFVARPVVAGTGCLKCHGDMATAPKGRVEKYPGPGGYGYQAGSVVAGFFNYIPIENALAKVKVVAMKSMAIGVVSILVILLMVWLFISRAVTRPIIRLTGLAEEISRGKGLATEISHKSKDEIGALYASFNRMRVSVIKLSQMLKQMKK